MLVIVAGLLWYPSPSPHPTPFADKTGPCWNVCVIRHPCTQQTFLNRTLKYKEEYFLAYFLPHYLLSTFQSLARPRKQVWTNQSQSENFDNRVRRCGTNKINRRPRSKSLPYLSHLPLCCLHWPHPCDHSFTHPFTHFHLNIYPWSPTSFLSQRLVSQYHLLLRTSSEAPCIFKIKPLLDFVLLVSVSERHFILKYSQIIFN